MKGAQAFDDLGGLKRFLENQVKNLKNEIHQSHNPVFSKSIKKKIRFVEWILKLIKSDEDFTYQELLDMIDLKTEAKEKDLANALGNNQKETIEDSIKSLGWLRNIIETTRGMGLTISYLPSDEN